MMPISTAQDARLLTLRLNHLSNPHRLLKLTMPPETPLKKLPDSANYIGPIIEALRSLSGFAKAASVKQWIADSMMEKNQEIPETILASGAQKFANDIQWARMYLVNAEVLEPLAVSGRGNWKLTVKGWQLQVTDATIRDIFEVTAAKGKAATTNNQDAPPEDPQQGELEGTGSCESDLKKLLTTMPDKGFERLCARIMDKNGLVSAKVTGKTGDGGVDGEGMLAVDDLGLIKIPVAWQCKRFADGNVSSSAIRDFRGAIEGRAKFGLVFTTSSFTPSAEAEARRPGATPIELVDLAHLISLMTKHALGVKLGGLQATVHEVDQAFFEEFVHPVVAPPESFKLSGNVLPH